MKMFKALSRITTLSSKFKKCNYFSTTSSRGTAYDADGRTIVTLLNQEPGLGIMIDSYSQAGFRLNNGIYVIGPAIIFPKTVLSWNITGDHEINEKSLSLFTMLEPKLDILLVGYGNESINDPRQFDNIILNFRKKRKHQNIEILPTEKAATTYNFIAAEGRFVAAALVPPLAITLTEDDAARTKQIKHQDIYGSQT